jgi:hypothetical protein
LRHRRPRHSPHRRPRRGSAPSTAGPRTSAASTRPRAAPTWPTTLGVSTLGADQQGPDAYHRQDQTGTEHEKPRARCRATIAGLESRTYIFKAWERYRPAPGAF